MRSCGGIHPRPKTRRICSRLDALVTIIAICSFHLRSFSIIKPRTLCDDTDSKAWSPTHKLGSSGLFRKKQISICLHFFAFNFIKLLDAHTSTEVKSDWIMDGSPILNRHSEREHRQRISKCQIFLSYIVSSIEARVLAHFNFLTDQYPRPRPRAQVITILGFPRYVKFF